MGCNHKKDRGSLGITILWCDPCAEKAAGPKPKNKWKHGDLAESRSWDNRDGPVRVLDSRDDAGSAVFYKKVKIVEDNS